MMCGNSDTSSDEGINIIQQRKINKGPQTGMTEQTVVNNISEPQFTELNNINLSPSSSSENVSLNMTISCSFNIPQSNSTLPQQTQINPIPHSVYKLNPVDCLDKTQPEIIQVDKSNTIMELLNLIYMEQIQSQIKYDHLLSKLNIIERAVNKIGLINNSSTVLLNFDDNFMLNWPMNNEQMFQNVCWTIHLFH